MPKGIYKRSKKSLKFLRKLCKALAQNRIGIALTNEQKNKISRGVKGKLRGYRHSKKTKLKMSLARKGKRTSLYKKIGSITKYNEYYFIKIANYKWIALHRYLVEKYLNRKLKTNEVIHHIDGNKLNNKLENFYIFNRKSTHMAFETLIRDKIINRYYLKSNLKQFKKNNRTF